MYLLTISLPDTATFVNLILFTHLHSQCADVESILDVTQLWKEIEFKSQPYIVHLRYEQHFCIFMQTCHISCSLCRHSLTLLQAECQEVIDHDNYRYYNYIPEVICLLH